MKPLLLIYMLLNFSIQCFSQDSTLIFKDFQITLDKEWRQRNVSWSKTLILSASKIKEDNISNVIIQKVDPKPVSCQEIWDLTESEIQKKLFYKVEDVTFYEGFKKREINGKKFIVVYFKRKLKTDTKGIVEIRGEDNFFLRNNSLYVLEFSSMIDFYDTNKLNFDNILTTFKFN